MLRGVANSTCLPVGGIGACGDGVPVDVAGTGDVAGVGNFMTVEGVAGADDVAADGGTPEV